MILHFALPYLKVSRGVVAKRVRASNSSSGVFVQQVGIRVAGVTLVSLSKTLRARIASLHPGVNLRAEMVPEINV